MTTRDLHFVIPFQHYNFMVIPKLDSLLVPSAPVKLIDGMSSIAFSSSLYQGTVRNIFFSNNNRVGWEGLFDISVPDECVDVAPVKCIWLRGPSGECISTDASNIRAKVAIEAYEVSVLQIRCS